MTNITVCLSASLVTDHSSATKQALRTGIIMYLNSSSKTCKEFCRVQSHMLHLFQSLTQHSSRAASSALGTLKTDRLSVFVEQRLLAGASLEHTWSITDLSVDESSYCTGLVHGDHVRVERAWQRQRQTECLLSSTVRSVDALAQKVKLFRVK